MNLCADVVKCYHVTTIRNRGSAMKELSELIERLSEEWPTDWDSLPDIELYRDQVLGYMKRQHSLQPESAQLTGAMINNYIKSGLLPRANGKKYTKDHLVYLTAICSLKHVLSMGDADALMKLQPNIGDARKFYEEYLAMMEKAFLDTAAQLEKESSREQLAASALYLAISSYAQKLACEKVLELLKEEEGPAKEKQKQNKKPGK